MATAPVKLVERFYAEVWNQADEGVAREILAEDFRFRGSLGAEKVGQDGFIAYMRSVHRALGDYVCIIEEVIETDGRVACRMLFKGKHQAEFFGVGATGRVITWTGAAFFRVHDGRIAELWVLGDIDSVKTQLGAQGTAEFATD